MSTSSSFILNAVDKQKMNTRCLINERQLVLLPMEDDDDIRIFLRDQSREWLNHVSESTGWSINAIAKRARVSVANLNKLVNQPDFPHPMSETVKIKISRATGIDLPGDEPKATPSAPKQGMKEPEARPFVLQSADIERKNGVDWWKINTNLLDAEGILSGDLVEIDLNATPKPNDCVIAQMTVGGGKEVETIVRKFEPPMLTCHTVARQYPKPEYVDGERIIIMGVVTEVRRVLRSTAA